MFTISLKDMNFERITDNTEDNIGYFVKIDTLDGLKFHFELNKL